MSIEIKNVNYLYSQGTSYEMHALKNVNLEIPDGQFVGLIGHTGSGKSTLTQHLNGLVKATSGHIYYNGEDIYDEKFSMKKLRSKVGLVFQYPEHQLFETEVLADVCFGPKNLGFTKEEAEEKAKAALRMVGMGEEYDKSSPFELSGGQKRRVAIAGVLAMDPEVLILDEPTAGLDVIARDSILELLREYMETEGRSILISSHISSDLESLCDDIYMIDKGRIVLHENTDVLLDEYGLIKADEKQYELLDKQHILKVKKEQYGYSCLTDERAFYAENYPQLAIERGSVDNVITMMIKGEVL